MQRNKISFKGQKIYIGIDVHAKTWEVCVLTESGYKERHPQQASAKTLFDFLKKHFPDGEYHAVYESGFSGFSTYYALKEYGINCVVTHAADVPTTQYEEVMKTFRGNKHLGPMIIEAAWIAIYRDYGLGMAYARYKQSMKPQEAIVKIARKMSNIIFSVLKNSRKYEPYRWDKE